MIAIMAITLPTSEPSRVRAGDTVAWVKSLADYPANAGWTLSYRAVNASGAIDITTAASGADHRVNVAPATSAVWVAGDYTLLAWVTDGTDRVTLPPAKITILPNLAAVSAAGYDARSQAKKMLDAIDAALLSLASGERLAVIEAECAARRVKYDLTGLMKLRNVYAASVAAEDNAERAALGLGPRNKLNVRL